MSEIKDIRIPNSPCKDCEKRFLGCHSTCKDYIAFKEYRAEVQKVREEYFAKHVRYRY